MIKKIHTYTFVPSISNILSNNLINKSIITEARRGATTSPMPEPEQTPILQEETPLEIRKSPEPYGQGAPVETPLEGELYGELYTENANTLFITPDPDEELGPKDQLPPNVAQKIVQAYAIQNDVTEKTALMAITRLVQEGGTNSSKPNLKKSINGHIFDLNDLRKQIQVHSKTGTVRKLAKTLRNIIAHIALINNYPGPLFKDLIRTEPELKITQRESIFCNEIHSDNYNVNVPPKIREALQRRETLLREQRLQIPPTKPRRKGGKGGKANTR